MKKPEVFFGSEAYGNPISDSTQIIGKPIDMWALGCIFVELFFGKPLF